MSSAARASSSSSRAMSVSRAPSSASSRAMTRPSPRDPPVMTTDLCAEVVGVAPPPGLRQHESAQPDGANHDSLLVFLRQFHVMGASAASARNSRSCRYGTGEASRTLDFRLSCAYNPRSCCRLVARTPPTTRRCSPSSIGSPAACRSVRTAPDAWVTAIRRLPAQTAAYAPFPDGTDDRLRDVLSGRGISQLYTHQAAAIEHALAAATS